MGLPNFVAPQTSDQWAKMDKEIFQSIASLVKELAGIHLTEGKLTMMESRLVKRLRETNIKTFKEYFKYLQTHPEEVEKFINVMTTNKTEFFREDYHFKFMKDTLLQNYIKERKGQPLRFWSAASSSGQEAYTMGMILREFFTNSMFDDFRILGTDIDTEILKKATAGVYPASIVDQYVPPHFKSKYFMRGNGENKGLYRMIPELTSITKFRQFNLIQDEFSIPIKFDAIFLRNVLIYFDRDTIEKVINKMHWYLKPGGYLLIGHSETLSDVKHQFKSLGSAVYRKAK